MRRHAPVPEPVRTTCPGATRSSRDRPGRRPPPSRCATPRVRGGRRPASSVRTAEPCPIERIRCAAGGFPCLTRHRPPTTARRRPSREGGRRRTGPSAGPPAGERDRVPTGRTPTARCAGRRSTTRPTRAATPPTVGADASRPPTGRGTRCAHKSRLSPAFAVFAAGASCRTCGRRNDTATSRALGRPSSAAAPHSVEAPGVLTGAGAEAVGSVRTVCLRSRGWAVDAGGPATGRSGDGEGAGAGTVDGAQQRGRARQCRTPGARHILQTQEHEGAGTTASGGAGG